MKNYAMPFVLLLDQLVPTVFILVFPFFFPPFVMQEKATEDVPMPSYFRFLALLAFKIFAAEQVSYVSFNSRYYYVNEWMTDITFASLFSAGRCCYTRGWIRWKV